MGVFCPGMDKDHTCPAYALLEEGRYDAVPRYLCQYTEHSLGYMKKELEKIGDE